MRSIFTYLSLHSSCFAYVFFSFFLSCCCCTRSSFDFATFNWATRDEHIQSLYKQNSFRFFFVRCTPCYILENFTDIFFSFSLFRVVNKFWLFTGFFSQTRLLTLQREKFFLKHGFLLFFSLLYTLKFQCVIFSSAQMSSKCNPKLLNAF